MSTTANQAIDIAYRKIGVLSPTTTQTNEAFVDLNNMLGIWGSEFLVPSTTRESFALIIGQAEYTIGTGGNFNTVRPLQLVGAYIRDTALLTDISLSVMGGQEFNMISAKATETAPTSVYYLPEYPLGKIIFNCEADSTDSCYFEFIKGFTVLTALSTTISLPAEYIEAIVYNLAIRIAEGHTMDVPASVVAMADGSRMLIGRLAFANEVMLQGRFPLTEKERAEYKGASAYSIYASGIQARK